MIPIRVRRLPATQVETIMRLAPESKREDVEAPRPLLVKPGQKTFATSVLGTASALTAGPAGDDNGR